MMKTNDDGRVPAESDNRKPLMCLWCGRDPNAEPTSGGALWWIVCDCGAHGPRKSTQHEATVEWNKVAVRSASWIRKRCPEFDPDPLTCTWQECENAAACIGTSEVTSHGEHALCADHCGHTLGCKPITEPDKKCTWVWDDGCDSPAVIVGLCQRHADHVTAMDLGGDS